MPDATELVRLIKKTAVDAVQAAKPANVMFGKVTSVKPLKIMVEQKLTLGASQLVLSRNVTDFQTTATIKGENTTITVHNGLAVGDKVILIRQQGGQKFIVTDRSV